MKILQPATTTLALLLGLAWSAPRASADWIETFTGGYDQTWTIFDDHGIDPPTNTSVSTSGNVLTLLHDPAGDFDGSVAGLVTTELFTDVLVRATVSPTAGTTFSGAIASSNNDMFVVARSDGNLGYLLSLDFNDGQVDLGRVAGGVFTGLTDTVEETGWFNPADSYTLELLVHGTSLRGRVFDLGGDLLAELTASDATHASGRSGVGAAVNTDSIAASDLTRIAAVFDNVSSTAVPEPSTLLLAIGGAFGMVAIRRRRAA